MKTLGYSLALATTLGLASATQAALINVVEDADATAFTLTDAHDYSDLAGKTGVVGGHIYASTDAEIELTFEYLFKEAGLTNSFWVDGQEVFNTATATAGQSYTTTWTGGSSALDFRFLTGLAYVVDNAPGSADQNNQNAPQKFISYWDGVSDEILLGLDDSGASQDDDFDDLVIRVTAKLKPQSVPEPTTLALLGLGIVGAGLARGRGAR